MSAWIVSADHIDALVCGAIVYGIPFDGEEVTAENASAVGQALWRENHKSVNHRYDLRDRTPAFAFVGETTLRAISLFKQACCYNYQTCEHDGYERSAAKAFVDALKEACLRELGMTSDQAYESAGYDAAPWGI